MKKKKSKPKRAKAIVVGFKPIIAKKTSPKKAAKRRK